VEIFSDNIVLILVVLAVQPYLACFLLGAYCKRMHSLQAHYFYTHWKAYVGHANLPPPPIRSGSLPQKPFFKKSKKGKRIDDVDPYD